MVFCLLILTLTTTLAQEQLDSVTVQAFTISARLRDLPAGLGTIRQSDWLRFSPASPLPALNTIPGVRMEERSPGSYRLALRGSSLRSPFGVRNVRVYLGNTPFTDPGGNTYLNSLPLSFLDDIDILKGPAGSHYGAGTGGVLLARTDSNQQDLLTLQYLAGSYGLNQADLALRFSGNELLFQHQQSDGYRDHTRMRRDALSWKSALRQTGNSMLSARVLYSDLYYETPGGLNLSQFAANPKQARPAAGIFPSASGAAASIRQRLFFMSMEQQWQPVERLSVLLSMYGAYTQLENPSIRNYEKRTEPHAGARAVVGYDISAGSSRLHLQAGGEYQEGRFRVDVYGNKGGQPDTTQTRDAVKPQNAFVFGSADWYLPAGFQLGAAVSWNRNRVGIVRESVYPQFAFHSNYSGEWAPRFSLLKQLGPVSGYVVLAKGFSPPTTAELLPSTSIINQSLQAEWGWNHELGFRGTLWRGKGWFDLNLFYFKLQDAIVQRRDDSGADYFENAGHTRQKGLELSLRYPVKASGAWRIQPWFTYSLYSFRYKTFVQVEDDFSGHRIPGVARQQVNAGVDLSTSGGQTLAVTYQYSDPIWLNDANTEKASPFQLLGLRLGTKLGRQWQVFAGADNLLNMTYSLGNDINAAAGRYYNVAAGRNFYGGLRFSLPSPR